MEHPSKDCRSSVFSAIFSAIFTFISRQIELIIGEMETQYTSCLAAPESVQPDDDVALYRLFGFSFHASMHVRTRATILKRSKIGRKPNQSRITKARRIQYCKQLELLKAMLEYDKTVIPTVIKLQDRGRMKFPHRVLIPFCRLCSLEIKRILNRSNLKTMGRKISVVSWHNII